MKTLAIALLWVAAALVSCSQGHEPINYGKDNCHWCYMRIMDSKFGAEVVTNKGRVYKFDATECMVNYVLESKDVHSHILVTNFEKPNVLTEAESCWYLVSEKMMSPMGGNLNAFESKERAGYYQEQNGGEIYTWNEILDEYRSH